MVAAKYDLYIKTIPHVPNEEIFNHPQADA